MCGFVILVIFVIFNSSYSVYKRRIVNLLDYCRAVVVFRDCSGFFSRVAVDALRHLGRVRHIRSPDQGKVKNVGVGLSTWLRPGSDFQVRGT